MGKEIEKIAIERNHKIILKIDSEKDWDFYKSNLKESDVAIDFSTPQSAVKNIKRCFNVDVPIVVGTTGWYNQLENIKNIALKNNKTLFYAPNFSIGVNIFFDINRRLAKLMDRYKDYNVSIQETHHIHKLDAPSGTAISLANDIINNIDRKIKWVNSPTENPDELEIKSIRKDNITGIHTVNYDSLIDTIEIKHTAKSRKGFAIGAVLAAEWLSGRKGVFEMKDMLFG